MISYQEAFRGESSVKASSVATQAHKPMSLPDMACLLACQGNRSEWAGKGFGTLYFTIWLTTVNEAYMLRKLVLSE